jgi:hypothetical protein
MAHDGEISLNNGVRMLPLLFPLVEPHIRAMYVCAWLQLAARHISR